jgi:hypothetical protein
MRRIILIALMIFGATLAFAQTDSATGDRPAAITDQSAATVDQPAAAEDQPAAAEDQPAAAEDQPAAAEDQPAAAEDQPVAADDQSAVTTDQPATAEEQPAVTSDQVPPTPGNPSATSDQTLPTPDEPAATPEQPKSEAENLAEIERLSAKLEEANGIIDELRTESYDLKSKALDAEEKAEAARKEADKAGEMAATADKRTAAAQAISDAAEAQRKAAEDAAARAEAFAEDAKKLESKVTELEAKIAGLESGRDTLYGKLASFGSLRIETSSFPEILRSGFSDSKARLGTWKASDGVLAQTDKNQYFSRLTFPLVQSSEPVLYSFETKTGAKGWVGTGLHLFAEGVKKSKGFGEGKSLLVWLTRDAKVRGNNGSYLQVYRSDSDVSMERVLDAKIKERLEGWNRIDVLYEPANEFIVIAVNGSVRAAYRTYFGIGAGVAMSLRTLGEGVQFRNLEVRK